MTRHECIFIVMMNFEWVLLQLLRIQIIYDFFILCYLGSSGGRRTN